MDIYEYFFFKMCINLFYLSFLLSIILSIYLLICLFIYIFLFIFLSIFLSIILSIFQPFCLGRLDDIDDEGEDASIDVSGSQPSHIIYEKEEKIKIDYRYIDYS